ncbi:hypothetical protein BSKO_03576 [Bryopsis sp. KO-2023]|nr:hypothetical protein BSKO_03576 [Bryopsis sp. KO-2023]
MATPAPVVPVRSFPTTWSTPVTVAATTVDDCATAVEEASDENSWKSPFREYEKRKTRQSTLLIGRNVHSSLAEHDLKENILGMRRSGGAQGNPCKQHRAPILTWKTRALSGCDQVPKTPQDISALHKDTANRKAPKKSTPHNTAKPRLGRSCSVKSCDQVRRRFRNTGNTYPRRQAAQTTRPRSPCPTSKKSVTSVSTASARHASFSISRNGSKSPTETLRSRLKLDEASASSNKRQRPATAQGNLQDSTPTSDAHFPVAAHLKGLSVCVLNDVEVGQQNNSRTGKSRDWGGDRLRRPTRATGPTLAGCQVIVQPKELSQPRKFTNVPGVLPKEERILREFDPESLESFLGLSEWEDKRVDGCAYVTSPNPEFFGNGESQISVGGTGASIGDAQNTRDLPVSANRPPLRCAIWTPHVFSTSDVRELNEMSVLFLFTAKVQRQSHKGVGGVRSLVGLGLIDRKRADRGPETQRVATGLESRERDQLMRKLGQ